MNTKNTIPPINSLCSIQDICIDEVYQKIADAATDAENDSKEKYIAKGNLIDSANDMSTQEKLDAWDENYDRRNQERWKNLLYFTAASFTLIVITIGSPTAVRNIHKLFATS